MCPEQQNLCTMYDISEIIVCCVWKECNTFSCSPINIKSTTWHYILFHKVTHTVYHCFTFNGSLTWTDMSISRQFHSSWCNGCITLLVLLTAMENYICHAFKSAGNKLKLCIKDWHILFTIWQVDECESHCLLTCIACVGIAGVTAYIVPNTVFKWRG